MLIERAELYRIRYVPNAERISIEMHLKSSPFAGICKEESVLFCFFVCLFFQKYFNLFPRLLSHPRKHFASLTNFARVN